MEVEKNIKSIYLKLFWRIMDRKQKEKDKKELMDKQQLKLNFN